jgi:general secretion pathway protein J
MLENVTDFRIRFLDDQQTWRDNWPDDDSMAGQTLGAKPVVALPRGLEVIIEHERFGLLTRTFPMPDFDSDAAQDQVNASSAATGESEEQAEGASSGGASGG